VTEHEQLPTYRRIGTIFVERGLITEAQLAVALTEQQERGRPLGEICVERFGLDRLHLADVLASQWDEMRAVPVDSQIRVTPSAGQAATIGVTAEEAELRTLLEEAQAARTELESKTDELGQRLAALEALVADVSNALAEIRPAEQPVRTSRPKRRAARSETPASARGAR
jgi:septal ring factor EnvC (AmiA/AmiB activator)